MPPPIRRIVEKCLALDPRERPTAHEVCQLAVKELSAFLRRGSTEQRQSPIKELEQFRAYFPEKQVLALMPQNERERMRKRLIDLKETNGFDSNQQSEIERLLHQLVDA